jgi:hypothetical protein
LAVVGTLSVHNGRLADEGDDTNAGTRATRAVKARRERIIHSS